MATQVVGFSRGNSTRFLDIVKDANTLYFLTDTREIFLGPDRYAFGRDISVDVQGFGDCITNLTWDAPTKTMNITKGNAGDAASVRELLDDILEGYIKSVTAPRESAINVDNTNPQNPVVDLRFATNCPEEGNVKFGQCSEGLYASVEVPEIPVSGIDTNDKMLRLDNNKNITSKLSITTINESSQTYIVLQGFDGQEISRMNATDFTQDGLLESVHIEYKGGTSTTPGDPYLILEFKLDSGRTKTVEVNMKDLVDIYSAKAGGGLRLDDGAFSISNEVTPSSDGVNSDVTLEFGKTIPLKTITYDGHGNITGQKTFIVTMPALSGMVGDASNSKLVTFVGISNDGQLIGNTVDVITELSASATDAQVPTAKAVMDKIEEVLPVWSTI